MKFFNPINWTVALPQSNKLLQSISRLSSSEAKCRKLRSGVKILMPLYSLDPAKLQKELPLKTFGKTAQKSKMLSKKVATNTANFIFPDPKAPLALMSDGSLVAIEATLKQYVWGCWRLLGCRSKSLEPNKPKWTSFLRCETLAERQALRYFHTDIAGRHVVVYTDCKDLCHAFKSATSQDHDPHARAHLIEIGQWTRDIRHIEAKKNMMADYLSKKPYSQ